MNQKTSLLLPFILLTLSSTLYWITKSPSILWVDAGTMIAAAYSLGIPNPPGFPFFMLSSHLFSIIPAGTVLVRMQLFTIVSSLLLLYLVYRIIVLLTQNDLYFYKRSQPSQLNASRILSPLAGFFGSITLAFSYQYWSQSTNTDAFIFSYLFIVLFIYLLVNLSLKHKAYIEQRINLQRYSKNVLGTFTLVAFLYGLAAGTNPTVAAFIPAVLFVMYLNRHFLREKQIILLAVIFAGTLAVVYSYLPIRAKTYPFVNWGNPQTPELFVNHLRGKGLDIYEPELGLINGFTGSPDLFLKSIIYIGVLTLIQFTPILVPIMLFGLFYIYKKNRKLLIFLVLSPLTVIVQSGLYSSGNKESWLIQIWIFLSIFLGVGFYYLATTRSFFIRKPLLLFSLCFLPLLMFFPILNRSNQYHIADYIHNLYQPLEKNAILIGEGDFFNSLSNYVHVADKYRPDVTPIVINNFFAQRWYRNALRNATNLSLSNEIEDIVQNKGPDEYNRMVTQIIDENIQNHPIYILHLTQRLSAIAGSKSGLLQLDKKYRLIPNGLSLQVVDAEDKRAPNLTSYEYKIRSALSKKPYYLEKNYNNGFERLLFTEYLYSYEALGDWYLEKNDDANALKFYTKARDLAPDNFEVLARFGEYYQLKLDYKKAQQYLEKASIIRPENPSNHFNLALVYNALGETDAAKKEFEIVKEVAFRDDPIIAQSDDQIKKMDTPSFFKQNTPQQASDWKEIQDTQNNVAIKIPPGYSIVNQNKDLNNVDLAQRPLLISNKLSGNQSLNIAISGREERNINFEDYTANLPTAAYEVLLDSRDVNLELFRAKIQTIGSTKGDFYQRFILTNNIWVWQISVYPGNSLEIETFYDMLKTLYPLE